MSVGTPRRNFPNIVLNVPARIYGANPLLSLISLFNEVIIRFGSDSIDNNDGGIEIDNYMENEVIFSCAKTVLSAIIKPTAANFDASKNVLILMDKLKISSNHFMTQLLLRLDRNSKQQQEAEKGAGDSKKSSVKKSNGLMFDVLSLQDEMKLQREAAHNVVNDNGSTSPAIVQHVTDTLPSPPPRTSLLTVVKEDQENAENQSSDNGSTSQPVEKGEDKLTNMMQGLHVSSPDSPTKTSTAASDLMSRIARLKALSDQKGISNVTN